MLASEKIAALQKQAVRASAEVVALEKLVEAHPDLEVHIDRWRRERYAAKSANSLVDRCEISHNCGCCNDSPLEVRPYVERGGVRVYSVPTIFTVGEKVPGGDRPELDWETDLVAAGIGVNVRDQVRAYFDAHTPKEEDDDLIVEDES